ncbi:hypothetical protein SALBM311S_01150 [Streptomyces alboniger]
MTGKGVEFGALVADGLELELFGLDEGLRASEDPSGDRFGATEAGRSQVVVRCASVQVGTDALVAALAAERHDLLPQLPRVGEALVPAVVQVGSETVSVNCSHRSQEWVLRRCHLLPRYDARLVWVPLST